MLNSSKHNSYIIWLGFGSGPRNTSVPLTGGSFTGRPSRGLMPKLG